MRTILLDTNVLLLFLLGKFDRDRVGQIRRTEQFVVEDFDLLLEILEPFEKLLTTPHILTEVCNLADRIDDEARALYFAFLAKTFETMQEGYTPSADLAKDKIFLRLGLADTAISRLAHETNSLVLTTDLKLWLHLQSVGVESVNFNHVRMHGWNP